MPENASSLTAAREQALAVRSQYEVLEERFNGKTWSLHELMIGFSNDVGQIGRLLLAHDGTWGIDGDPRTELEHKLAESMWWTFVLADKLDIDLVAAYTETMASIRAGLEATIARTAPTQPTEHLQASDAPEHVQTPSVHYVSVLGDGAPGSDEFYRKKILVSDIARILNQSDATPVVEIQFWYPENSTPVEIADFYSVNPIPSLLYRVLAQIPAGTTETEIADARSRAASAADVASDDVMPFTIPEQNVIQVMHHGPFAEEFATLERLGDFARDRDLHRAGPHHEIHLDAFTRTTPQHTLRTILRDPVV